MRETRVCRKKFRSACPGLPRWRRGWRWIDHPMGSTSEGFLDLAGWNEVLRSLTTPPVFRGSFPMDVGVREGGDSRW